MSNKTIHALTLTTSIADADEVPIWVAASSGTKRVSKVNFVSGISGGASTWTAVSGTTVYASSSTITMGTDNTSTVKAGYGVQYTQSAVVYYGIITAITSGLITIAGASIANAAITGVKWCPNWNTEVITITDPGQWEDAADTTLLENDLLMKGGLIWKKGPAYMVLYTAIATIADTSTAPNVTPTVGGNAVSTANTNKGVAVSATVATSVVDINTTNYALVYGSAIELKASTNAGGLDSSNLTVEMVIVYA
jgi:hypothetical protein